jgi:hypothetical protein
MPTVTQTRQVPNATTDSLRAHYVCLRGKPLPVANASKVVPTVQSYPSKWIVARLLLVLLLSAMPILAISVDVFALVPQRISAIVVVTTLAATLAIMTLWPHRTDLILGRGLIAEMVEGWASPSMSSRWQSGWIGIERAPWCWRRWATPSSRCGRA